LGLVRDGLLSDYVPREDSLHMLRGHLRLIDQLKRHFGQVDPLEVAFDEFETDIPENQIIAAALDATRSVIRHPIVQRPIRRLHSIFLEATDITAFDALEAVKDFVYTRRTERYRSAHQLARLLVQRLSIRDLFTPGGTNSFAFLLDMNALFEAFVSRLAADAFTPMSVRVYAQRRDTSIIFDDATGKRYSSIIPDLLFESRTPSGVIRLPVDAKYKLYDNKKIQESDVYQTFFYAFAYAPTRRQRPARAVILFPRAGDGNDVSLSVDTHDGRQSARIQAFGVDIELALQAIQEQRITVPAIPAFVRVWQVLSEVRSDIEGGTEWLASSA